MRILRRRIPRVESVENALCSERPPPTLTIPDSYAVRRHSVPPIIAFTFCLLEIPGIINRRLWTLRLAERVSTGWSNRQLG